MSSPLMRTTPSVRQSGLSSFMRSRARRKVLLAEPGRSDDSEYPVGRDVERDAPQRLHLAEGDLETAHLDLGSCAQLTAAPRRSFASLCHLALLRMKRFMRA